MPRTTSFVGLAVLLIGALADLLYHALPVPQADLLQPLLGSQGANAHLVTLLGMVLIVAGLVSSQIPSLKGR